MAGSKHHHKIYMNRFHPGYFGKITMRYYNMEKVKYYCPTINVETLWSLVGEEVRQKYKDNKKEAPVIDVTKHGFFKVLSKGTLPDQPIVVRAIYLQGTQFEVFARRDVLSSLIFLKTNLHFNVGI